jgi:chemotaxis protein MotA
MITLPFGFFVVGFVVYYALHGVELENFLNFHSFVIVIVGTVAALALSAPSGTLKRLVFNLIRLYRPIRNKDLITKTLHQLVENKNLKIQKDIHPLIDFAQDMWEQGLSKNLFEELLMQRLEELSIKSEEPVSTLKNLAKYPPALGMMGTVMGMVELFANLNADNKDMVGANLALAMTATFYGLFLANLFITPLSDRLFVQHLGDVKLNEYVFNAIIYINRNEPLAVIENCDGERKAA